MNTVAVIGGGASGMMAAITAAEDKNNHVILFERQQRVGRKLMATGNGRCNLSNLHACPENYHGEVPGFPDRVLAKFPPEAALEFFRGLGLVTVAEPDGRVYPLSDSANSVVDVLRFALEKSGVELRAACPVQELKRAGSGYKLVTDAGSVTADFVIVACGGAAGAKLGGVNDGYELLGALGHPRTKLYPALVQLTTDSEYPRALKGIRADARLRLFAGSALLAESAGEMQFTEKGVSGPAVFELSRAASTGGEGLRLQADFFRDYGEDAVETLLRDRCCAFPALECAEVFTGMLHNRLGRMLSKYAGVRAGSIGELNEKELAALVKAAKAFTLSVKGTEGFDSAQVTAGGIKTGGFDPETLESRRLPGLFVCGELLDVDGDCGGYNLQWAWASGRTAGRLGK